MLRTHILRERLLVLPALMLFGLAGLEATHAYVARALNQQVVFPGLQSAMMDSRHITLEALVDAEAQALAKRVSTLPTRQEEVSCIVAETDPIRFFEDRLGYFFTYDLNGKRINNPISKAENGKNLMNAVDQHVHGHVQAFVEQAKAGGASSVITSIDPATACSRSSVR